MLPPFLVIQMYCVNTFVSRHLFSHNSGLQFEALNRVKFVVRFQEITFWPDSHIRCQKTSTLLDIAEIGSANQVNESYQFNLIQIENAFHSVHWAMSLLIHSYINKCSIQQKAVMNYLKCRMRMRIMIGACKTDRFNTLTYRGRRINILTFIWTHQ